MDRKSEGWLTTHILDTAAGRPAAGMEIALYRIGGENRTLLKTVKTNADGRCDEPLLEGSAFALGEYELIFQVGAYLRANNVAIPAPAFLDRVPIRFGMAEHAHYHVPLLVSPYGYSTYRGS
ncbi:hydroxyisourate hydrolase [Chelativorans sp. YIM 93263]|uniref:hydroxyisourate hydrolase n=1 Tax=Chelativorans sp. YIM 93263 TaxID=2906648 RepID=UPI002378055A|nr:hydroxyisourate hydrolase [Chelativorans sp. YIM 93263]